MTPFIVSLELRASAVTDRADVVFPVAAVAEKTGTFVNWEGRGGTFGAALSVPSVRTDLYVLGSIADEMDVHLGLPDAAAARAELAALGAWQRRPRPAGSAVCCRRRPRPSPASSGIRLGHLASAARRGPDAGRRAVPGGHRRETVARMSAATAAAAGVGDGDKVTVATTAGSVTVPAEIVPMADGVVWLPTNSPGSAIRAGLGAGHGSRVTLRRAE